LNLSKAGAEFKGCQMTLPGPRETLKNLAEDREERGDPPWSEGVGVIAGDKYAGVTNWGKGSGEERD